jgi:uncharacterized membrane protein (DUF485 family)
MSWNRLVAKIFGGLVAIIHFLFFTGIVIAWIYFHSDEAKKFRELMKQADVPYECVDLFLLGVTIVYIFIVGFISTIISINENLEQINAADPASIATATDQMGTNDAFSRKYPNLARVVSTSGERSQ